jgi:hypothetical protein
MIASNRDNSQRSTGPRTKSGKQRSSRNAFRHGLSITARSDPTLSAEIERLSIGLAGEYSDAYRLGLARSAAEAHD